MKNKCTTINLKHTPEETNTNNNKIKTKEKHTMYYQLLPQKAKSPEPHHQSRPKSCLQETKDLSTNSTNHNNSCSITLFIFLKPLKPDSQTKLPNPSNNTPW